MRCWRSDLDPSAGACLDLGQDRGLWRGQITCLPATNASRALGIADRGYVMESGSLTMTGDAAAMLNDPRVQAAYLGE